jgi:hypothetical protein
LLVFLLNHPRCTDPWISNLSIRCSFLLSVINRPFLSFSILYPTGYRDWVTTLYFPLALTFMFVTGCYLVVPKYVYSFFSQPPPHCMIVEPNGSSVNLLNQHAKLMPRIILSPVACLTVPHFSTLSHNATIFEKTLLKIKFVFWFSPQFLSEAFLTLRRIH